MELEFTEGPALTGASPNNSPSNAASESHAFRGHLTIKEVAKELKVSESKARTLFFDYPGVVKIKSARRHSRRGYTLLRVPVTVFATWHQEHTRGFLEEFQDTRRNA